VLLGGRRLLRDTRANNQRLSGQEAGAMVSRTQVDRLAARIEALAAKPTKEVIVVVDPSKKTEEEALTRLGRSRSEVAVVYFVHTGVPRSKDWGKDWRDF
jgi:ribosomal protein L15E